MQSWPANVWRWLQSRLAARAKRAPRRLSGDPSFMATIAAEVERFESQALGRLSSYTASSAARCRLHRSWSAEALEARQLLSGLTPALATQAVASPAASGSSNMAVLSPAPVTETVASPAASGSTTTSVYTPAQIAQAYGVNQITFGSVKGTGAGQTIAIVDAYAAPDISSDLATFDSTFNLPNTDSTGAPALTIATPEGTPAYNAGWAEEITLDVEWAHAIAPGAHILLVEAASSNLSDLLGAVNYARNQPGVSVVSMSWGSSEFSGETADDSDFTTPAGHANVAFIASAGDTGAVTEWPAVSPNVVAVGGTQLSIADSTGTYGGETAWSASGGGISLYEAKPTFQAGVTQSGTNRTSPDVAWDASPNSGVYVYFSGNTPASGGWYAFGGTSVGAPSWAGVVAIADQGRALAGETPLDGPSQLLPALYSLPASDFHDITSGSATNGSVINQAGAGYDLVTGRGSPYANLVVAGLVGGTSSSPQPQPPASNPPPSTLTAPQVSATVLSSTAVELQWNSVSGTQGYRVYIQQGTQRVLLGTVSSTTTAVEITGLLRGETAKFQVEAFTGTQVADSAWVTVTTTAGRFVIVRSDTYLGLLESASWETTQANSAQGFGGSDPNQRHQAW